MLTGAAVPVFSSLDSPARRVAFGLSRYSSPSPSPTLSSSSNPSALDLHLSSLRYKRRSRRRIAEATASSFSIDSDEEERFERATVLQFAGKRNAKERERAREDSSSKARVSGASNDQGKLSWTSPKQQIRGVKPFDMHQARVSMSVKNAHAPRNHDRDNAIAHNKGRNFLPLQKQCGSSFEEEQHHGSFVAKKHPRVPLPTQNQWSRMHNKVSPFEGIRQPSILGLSSKNRTDTSSWHVEEADVAPSNLDRQALVSYKSRLKYSQLTTQHGIQESMQRGTKFMSKLEEVLSNLKKKDNLSRQSPVMNQEALRDDSTFRHAGKVTTSEGKKSEERGVFGSLKRKGMQGAKSDIESSARYANKPIATDDNGGFPLINDGKGSQSEPGEARSLLKENGRVVDEVGVTSFNLFSSSPSVPWETDRKYSSMFKPRIPISRGNVSPSARRLVTSIGSRSSPSRSSVNSRNDSYLKLDSHATTGVVDPSKLIRGDEKMKSWFEDREDIELNDDKCTTQIASQKGASTPEEQVKSLDFDWSELDAEENEDNALSMYLSTEENAPSNSSVSAASPQGIFNWYDSDSDEDNVSSIDSDVEDDVPPEFGSTERSHPNKKNSVYSVDSDVQDAGPPEVDSSERSLHNKTEILSASMTHNKHTASADFPVYTTLSASEMGNGSNHTKSGSWHKHNLPDLPFEFQFSYSETPKAPILGYRETPYSPFGPHTMGRPWMGGPPPKPSKKKQRVFDSFNPPPKDKKGVKFVQDPGPYPEGQSPKPAKSREEIMGEPLTKKEIVYLVEKCERESRQLNLGRDGLTHNMLDLIHCHWKRRRVCKIKCKGVPTVDMDNVKFHIEDKTGGKIIYQAGGVLYLFRGRNYNYKDRPQVPLMLWKPVTPLYPNLIQPAPEGLTTEEAKRLRVLGRKVQPICRLGKNGVYLNLVKDVRAAFKVDELVRIDCRGLNPRDYRKIGAKLKDLVPCVLLSFDKEHILMWKGKQEPPGEGRSFSRAPEELQLAGEENLKESSIADEYYGHSICEEKVNISIAETSDSAHARQGETEEKIHEDDSAFANEGGIEEKLHQSYSEREFGNVLDYASYSSQEVSTHSSDAEATLAIQLAKEQVSVIIPDTTSEGMSNSVNSTVGNNGDKELVPFESASSEKKIMHEAENGLASDEKEVSESLDNRTHSVLRLDALWDHAFSSGMAVEISEAGMDEDVIVRTAAQLAQSAPLGPTYTIKLMYKLKSYEDRSNDALQIRFGRGKPPKIPKNVVVKRKSELPTLNVPGMGGLPVDELARLLAPKQPT